LKLLNYISHVLIRMFTGDTPRSMAPEILANMRLSASKSDASAFAGGVDELMDDAVRMVYNAKFTSMSRRRRREVRAMTSDEMASWLYDMCMNMDSMADMPPLKARMMLASACARHAGKFA